jgi:hypothetical protein
MGLVHLFPTVPQIVVQGKEMSGKTPIPALTSHNTINWNSLYPQVFGETDLQLVLHLVERKEPGGLSRKKSFDFFPKGFLPRLTEVVVGPVFLLRTSGGFVIK